MPAVCHQTGPLHFAPDFPLNIAHRAPSLIDRAASSRLYVAEAA